MSREEIIQRYPNASESFIRANLQHEGSRSNPIMERAACHAPLEAQQGKEADPSRVHIRFTSVRQRLCDPDNLSEKWLLDCLRYCRLIRGDEPDKITLETTQRKPEKGEQEYTLIEIFEI